MAIDMAPLSRRRPGDTTCCPLNATPQRPANAAPSTDGDTTDFYGPINLAKALIRGRRDRPYYETLPVRRGGSAKFAVFARANGKQKLTISTIEAERAGEAGKVSRLLSRRSNACGANRQGNRRHRQS